MKAENTEKKSIKKTSTKGPSPSKQDRWIVRLIRSLVDETVLDWPWKVW